MLDSVVVVVKEKECFLLEWQTSFHSSNYNNNCICRKRWEA